MTITSPLGNVIRDDDGVRLEFVRTFPDPIGRVWAAVTEPDQLGRWFGTWTGDPTSGSVEFTSIEGDGTPSGVVTIQECDAPHRLAVVMPSADGAWPLSVDLSESEGVTTLVFVHRMAQPYDATGIGPGWQYFLDGLDAVVAGGAPPRDWSSYEALAGEYPLP